MTWAVARFRTPGPPHVFTDARQHFLYGSIGTEVSGLPYMVWRALPTMFRDVIPGGYESFGFITEKGRPLPVGVSVRRYGIDRVGLNCAACHTSRINGGEVILGAPAVQLDLEKYIDFLTDCGVSPRLTASNVFMALRTQGVRLSAFDRLLYRFAVIPRVRSGLSDLKGQRDALRSRPLSGPGRGDAGVSWRQKWGLGDQNLSFIGNVDFPSLWNQRLRQQLWLHWDGNNNSLDERNLSAALAAGASEDSLDIASIERVARWAKELSFPVYPFSIDRNAVVAGSRSYASHCAMCHEAGGARFGVATSIADLGTDPERWRSFSDDMLAGFNKVGAGRPWHFTHYRKSVGYANMPLDGIWARSPYLHNGSVPTLADLLEAPADRPRQFWRGCDAFDQKRVGLACDAPFLFDTSLVGNGNQGHEFGTRLSPSEKRDLIEFLKTR